MLNSNKDLYVFGAGSFGIEVATLLTQYGITVKGILDNVKTGTVGQWKIQHPKSADPDLPVALGVCNLAVDLNVVASDLVSYGFNVFYTPVHLFKFFESHGLEKDHYWLTTNSSLYNKSKKDIENFSKILIDDESKSLLESLISYRIEGEIDFLPAVHPVSHQYLPWDIEVVPSPIHLVDCGAYVGEFLDYANERNFSIGSYYAFEPDPTNYERLRSRMQKLPVNVPGVSFPLGVAEQSKQVRFSADGTLGAAISEHGDTVIQVTSLDNALVNIPINYIKMDIEGAEMDALHGAIKLLKKRRPSLAISAYHKPEDLWLIGLWLDGLDLGYKFAIRQYGHQCFDTVLYAFVGSE
jgi:FkbM family methyltransferase